MGFKIVNSSILCPRASALYLMCYSLLIIGISTGKVKQHQQYQIITGLFKHVLMFFAADSAIQY